MYSLPSHTTLRQTLGSRGVKARRELGRKGKERGGARRGSEVISEQVLGEQGVKRAKCSRQAKSRSPGNLDISRFSA